MRKSLVLAAIVCALALPASAQSGGDAEMFNELDDNGDGAVDREEFSLNKGAILYRLDSNRSLELEQSETKMAPQIFRQYAGKDNVIDGGELFEMPAAGFEAFDQDRDSKITRPEFRRQLTALRAGTQTAEQK